MVYSSLIGCMPRGPLPVWYHAGDTASLAGADGRKEATPRRILTQYWAKSDFYVSLCVVQNALYFGKSSSE